MGEDEMSGKIDFAIRVGRSLDPRYSCYVEWYWIVTGEDGTVTVVSPKYEELNILFHKIFVHEFLNDWMRDRSPDFTRKRITFDLPHLLDDAQTDFMDHWRSPEKIPNIYHRCNYPINLND